MGRRAAPPPSGRRVLGEDPPHLGDHLGMVLAEVARRDDLLRGDSPRPPRGVAAWGRTPPPWAPPWGGSGQRGPAATPFSEATPPPWALSKLTRPSVRSPPASPPRTAMMEWAFTAGAGARSPTP